ESIRLKGSLVAAALALMLLDTLAVLWMGGLFSRRGGRRRGAATTAALLIAVAVLSIHADPSRADDSKPGDAAAIEAIAGTRIAYVLTGEPNVDAVSRAGIEGLN